MNGCVSEILIGYNQGLVSVPFLGILNIAVKYLLEIVNSDIQTTPVNGILMEDPWDISERLMGIIMRYYWNMNGSILWCHQSRPAGTFPVHAGFFDGRNHSFDSGGRVDGFEVFLISPQNIEVRQKSLEDGV